jgi:hypothetical protein
MAKLNHLVQVAAEEIICDGCVQREPTKVRTIEYRFGNSDYRV